MEEQKNTNNLVKGMGLIDYTLIVVVIAVLFMISIVLVKNLNTLNLSYEVMTNKIVENPGSTEVEKAGSYSAFMVLSRAKDFANVKASCMLKGFC